MTSYWVLQANPRIFDVDGALQQLDELQWRVPQYTGAVNPGDGAVIWRSGPEAGVVGVGRVIGYPAELNSTEAEAAFSRIDGPEPTSTMVPLKITPAVFRPKAEVAALPGWDAHQVVTAPMGTVFPITDAQWLSLAPLLPTLPDYEASVADVLSPVFAWEQRRRDTYPLPGGYDGYLDSLRAILTEVESSHPARDELVTWLSTRFGVTEGSARFSTGFLTRTGVLLENGGTLVLGEVSARWLRDSDNARLVALLHSRVRFIGEFLSEVVEPKTDTEVLEIANRHYGAGWQTKAQIQRRRGWLQSAGMLISADDGRLQTTAAGIELVQRIDLHPRTDNSVATRAPATTAPSGGAPLPPPVLQAPPVLRVTESVLALAERLRTTASDGQAAEQFERETTEAFRRLGFRSEWRGGSGQTDVLLEADLGKDYKYRVVIDCKASSRGSVSQQIDWDTIDEHRIQHHAQHAAIVAAGFGGGRLPDRAHRHDAVLLTVEDLVDLLVQHDRVPLGLDTYRLLFTSGSTEEAMAAISEIAFEAERRIELMRAVIDQIRDRSGRMGALSARDLELLLSTSDELPDAVEPEITPLLRTLASPLLGILSTDGRDAVRVTSSPATGAAMLRLLADALDPHADDGEPPDS